MIGLIRAGLQMGRGAALITALLGLGVAGWGAPYAQAACVMERERADQPALFVRHLGPGCTELER